jgi:hypothetical protein
VFTVEQRDGLRARMLQLAEEDERVVAGAAVGSLADGSGDRFSDLDLTFGIADGVPVADVLDGWTRTLTEDPTFEAVEVTGQPDAQFHRGAQVLQRPGDPRRRLAARRVGSFSSRTTASSGRGRRRKHATRLRPARGAWLSSAPRLRAIRRAGAAGTHYIHAMPFQPSRA